MLRGLSTNTMSAPCFNCGAVIDCLEFGGIISDVSPSNGFYAQQDYTFLIDCPVGYVCFEGIFPIVITIPKDGIPGITIGQGGTMSLLGCQSLISATIPVGASASDIQELANSLFQQWALQQAQCNALTTIPRPRKRQTQLPSACLDATYSQRLTDSTGGATQSLIVTQGFLPPGMFLSGGPNGPIYLTGTPSQGGSFSFTLKFTSPGNVFSTDYTLNVTAIGFTPAGSSPTNMANATVGTPYSAAFVTPTYAVPPLSWQVVGGSLPPGLSLDEATGIVSGTPTGLAASYHFTILLQDHAS